MSYLGKRTVDDYQAPQLEKQGNYDRWGIKTSSDSNPTQIKFETETIANNNMKPSQATSLASTIETLMFPNNISFAGNEEQVIKKKIISSPFKLGVENYAEKRFPKIVLDAINADHENILTEIFHDLGMMCFISKNKIIFWKFEQAEEPNCRIFEFPDLVRTIMLCKITNDEAYFLVYLLNNHCHLYFFSRSFDFLDLNQAVILPEMIYHSYNNIKNNLCLLDSLKNLYLIEINDQSREIALIKVSKGLKLMKRIKRITRRIPFIAPISKENDYKIKFYQNFIFSLVAKKNKESLGKTEIRQSLYIYKILNNLRIEIFKKVNLKLLLQQNKILTQFNYELTNLLSSSSLINDFYFDFRANTCVILLEQGYEIFFKVDSLTIEKIEEFKFNVINISNEEGIYFSNYLSKDKITIMNKNKLFVLDKKLAPSLNVDTNETGAYALVEIPEVFDSLNMRIDFKRISGNNLDVKDILISFGQSSIKTHQLFNNKNLLSNVFTFEQLNDSLSEEKFYKFVISVIYELSVDRFCKILHKIIMDAFPSFNLKYIELLQNEFLPLSSKKPIGREISISLTSFHNCVLKYLLVFGEISSKTFKILFETKNLEGLIKLNSEYLNKTIEFNLVLKDFDTKSRSFLSIFSKQIKYIAPLSLIDEQNEKYVSPKTKSMLKSTLIKVESLCSYIQYFERVLAKEQNFELKTIKLKDKFASYLHIKPLFHEYFMVNQLQILNSEVQQIVFRTFNILMFFAFISTNIDKLPQRNLKILQTSLIKEFIFDNQTNSVIRDAIIYCFENLPTVRPKFIEYFFTAKEIEALECLQNLSLNFLVYQAEVSTSKKAKLKNSIKHLEFRHIKIFYYVFQQNNAFVDFVDLVVFRNEYVGQLIFEAESNRKDSILYIKLIEEMKDITNFIYLAIIKLLTNENISEKTIWESAASGIKYKFRNLWNAFRFNNKYQLILSDKERTLTFEKDLDVMSSFTKKEILGRIMKLVTQSEIDEFRENCLKLVLASNRPEILDSIDYGMKKKDIVNISNSKIVNSQSVGKRNYVYLIKYFNDQKNFKNAVELIMKIVSPNFYDKNFWSEFTNIAFEKWILLPTEETQRQNNLLFVELEKQKIFELNDLKNYLLDARSKILIMFEGNPTTESNDFSKNIAEYLYSIDRNMLTVNELEDRKDIFNSMLKSQKLDSNLQLLTNICSYYDRMIAYLKFNIHIPDEYILNEVWTIHKLDLCRLEIELRAESNNTLISSLFIKYIDERGIFNSQIEVRDFWNYFKIDKCKFKSPAELANNNPPSLNRDSEIVNILEMNSKLFVPSKNMIESQNVREMVDLKLIYPHNLQDRFVKHLSSRFNAISQQDLQKMIRKIEFYNSISEVLQIRSDSPDAFSVSAQLQRNWFILLYSDCNPHQSLYTLLNHYYKIYSEVFSELSNEENTSSSKVKFALLLSHQIFDISKLIMNNMYEFQTNRQSRFVEADIFVSFVEHYDEIINILHQLKLNIHRREMRVLGYTQLHLDTEITRIMSLAEKLFKSHIIQMAINKKLKTENS